MPRSLVALFPGAPREVQVPAGTVAEALRELDRRWPGMWDRLCTAGPAVREHINIFVAGEKAGLETTLPPGATVWVIPAVSGGMHGRRAQGARQNF
ncbi:MAG: MoaD/ThiS family protein [Firmicutes bacterium]|nr:MoaD/ThiS family protein [Bacillota bacterium]